MRSRKRIGHQVYLRLLEKVESQASDDERLAAVRRAVEGLGEIEWVALPTFHPRGGFNISFVVPKTPNVRTPDFENWLLQLENEGYMAVI